MNLRILCGVLIAFSSGFVPAAPLDLVVEVSPDRASVDAQLVYRMRFFHTVDVQRVLFRAPSARLAEVRPLGPLRRYEEMREGARHRVHEARYAVFPLASGELHLAGAQVTGYRPGWGEMRLAAPDQTIAISPAKPLGGDARHWIPAQGLRLAERFSGQPDQAWQVGLPVTRTLTIEAIGVDAGILPPLSVAADGFRIMPGAVRLQSVVKEDSYVARREQDFIFTPLRPGSLSFPDILLPWWNERDQRWALSVLPGREILVAQRPAAALATAVDPVSEQSHPVLYQVGQLVLLVAVFSVFFRRAFARQLRIWQARRGIAIACARQDAFALREALLRWGRLSWPHSPPAGLSELAERVAEDDFRRAVHQLQQRLYGRIADNDGADFASIWPARPWRVKWTSARERG